MKASPVIVFCVLAVALTAAVQGKETVKGASEFRDMQVNCINEMKRQIQMEIRASVNYLSMAAHFSKDTVNRPGFANFFFKAASEEREHGMKLIEYLLMRGELAETVTDLITVPAPDSNMVLEATTSGQTALTMALNLETQVTDSIRRVIMECEECSKCDKKKENFNHYHLVDYLTGEFLEEQYKGQRELAEKIKTLERMSAMHGDLSEFLFDKTLL